MIISKTPFRISFAGGLSDIGEYYQKDFGAVTSTSIDKSIYLIVNKRFGNDIQINYSKAEIVENVSQIQHPMVREALKLVNFSNIRVKINGSGIVVNQSLSPGKTIKNNQILILTCVESS